MHALAAMKITTSQTRQTAGFMAASAGGDLIAKAIAERGQAHIILATGASQFDMLAALVKRSDIDWSKCTVFHLDEYVGLAPTHKASFVRYLKERFVSRVSNLGQFEAIDGLNAAAAELARLNAAIAGRKIDVAFVGVGGKRPFGFQ